MEKIVIDIRSKIMYINKVACGNDRGKDAPGCSAVWLARVLWEHEAGGSNPFTPTQIASYVAPWSRGLRHRPFTAATRVRIPAESLFLPFRYGPLAQLVRAAGS